MRVLIVEDEILLAESIAATLVSPKASMIPSLAANGIHALSMIEQARKASRPYDAVILDLTLPGMDGMDILRAMRRAGDTTPVLILTARATLADRVDGLETGADDYLAKPFESDELLARLRAITRRRAAEVDTNNPTCGNLMFDGGRGAFTVDGAVLSIPPRQRAVLEILFRRQGQMINKDFFMNMDDDGASFESVHTQISRLRKRLHDAGSTAQIKTFHSVGYMLSDA